MGFIKDNMDEEIFNILKKIIWDYNISVEEIYLCLNFKKKRAGFYTRTEIIMKMLGHLYWYEIIKILSLKEIKKVLTKKNVCKIYPKGLQIKYEFLRKLLYNETISSSGWDNKDSEFPKYPILSNRWYSFK